MMPGFRVAVQFGKRKTYTAIIREVHQNRPVGFEIKGIFSIMDNKPVVNSFQLKFWDWISEYYMCTLGEVLRTALPSGLKLESETKILPLDISNHDINLTESEILIHSMLKKSHGITLKQLMPDSGRKDLMPVVKSMLEKGVIAVEEHLKERYQPKFKTYVSLTSEYSRKKALNELMNKLEKYPKQLDMLLIYLELSEMLPGKGAREVEKSDLLKKTTASGSVLTTLTRKGVFEFSQMEVSRIKEKMPSMIFDIKE